MEVVKVLEIASFIGRFITLLGSGVAFHQVLYALAFCIAVISTATDSARTDLQPVWFLV